MYGGLFYGGGYYGQAYLDNLAPTPVVTVILACSEPTGGVTDCARAIGGVVSCAGAGP